MKNNLVIVSLMFCLVTAGIEANAADYRIGKFFFRGGIGFGGAEQIPLYMVTNKGEELKLKSSSGVNFLLGIGYNINQSLGVEIQAGAQESKISPKVSNGDGYFRSTPLLILLDYRFLRRDLYDLYLNAGMAMYFSPQLYREGPGVTNTINYDDAVGPYLSVGWNIRFIPFSMFLEIGKPLVEYNFSDGSENGVAISAPFKEWDHIDSSIIFNMGVGYQF